MNSNVVEAVKSYELSDNQKNLWQIAREDLSPFYCQLSVEWINPPTVNQLSDAIELVCQQHEVFSFRLHFDEKYLFPMQASFQQKAFFRQLDEKAYSPEERLNQAHQAISGSFDPALDTPLRFCAFVEDGKVVHLVIRLYAIWGDSYSLVYFCRQLSEAVKDPQRFALLDIEKIDYASFSSWQNELIREPEEEAKVFWQSRSVAFQQQLMTTSSLQVRQSFRSKSIPLCKVAGEAYHQWKQSNGDLREALLCRFVDYLMAFADQEITLGYASFERAYEELYDTLGKVNKIVPLHFQKSDQSLEWKERLQQQKQQIEQVNAWADYFSLKRDQFAPDAALPFFEYLFEFVDLSKEKNQSFQLTNIIEVQDVYDLKLQVVDYGDALCIHLQYNEGAFQAQDAHLFAAQLKGLLEADLHSNIRLQANTADEAIYAGLNATSKQFEAVNSIVDLIEKQAEQQPESIALLYNEESWTYKDLEERSNQLANFLTAQYGLKARQPVCLLLERSPDFIVSVLAILKSGAYYIPVDPSYPDDRVRFMLSDSSCQLLLTRAQWADAFKASNLTIVDPAQVAVQRARKERPAVSIEPTQIAYCIYTSGSTGTPKACQIMHRNLLHYIQWANDFYFDQPQQGNWAFLTSVSFDLTVTSLFCSLARGRKFWIGRDDEDISILLKAAFQHPEIDTLKLTPSHLSLLKELDIQQTTVRRIICGGEALTKKQVDGVWAIHPDIRIFNEYGPTEATVGCIVKEILPEEKTMTIGQPIANTKVYLLNASSQLCPVGTIGEICIAGAGLTAGYLNRPELTKQKFIPAPFGEEQLWYLSGDLGKVLPDGNILYLGRKDDQVKIRGYRVELGGIAKQLQAKASIEEALVLLNENESGDKDLVAYFKSSETEDTTTLRTFLSKHLPSYMLPAFFIQLDKFPLTSSGKVDKKTLPNPASVALVQMAAYEAPVSEVERQLADIWASELKREKIGMADNFLLLGGDSIRAIRILSRMNKLLGADFTMADIYESPTIKELLAKCENQENKGDGQAEKEKINTQFAQLKAERALDEAVEDVYPMSDIEMGMLYANSMNETEGMYHDQVCYPVNILDFDHRLFTLAMQRMVEKHEALRTAYNFSDYSRPVRMVYKEVKKEIAQIDLSQLDKEEQQKQIESFLESERTTHPFQLEEPGLWRLRIYITGEHQQYLVLQFHHAVLDGWSRASLMTELNNTYFELQKEENFQPAPLQLTYKDYIVEQEYLKQNQEIFDYWATELDAYKRLNIFQQSFEIEDYAHTVSGELFQDIQQYCDDHQLSIRSLNFAAYLYTLRMLAYEGDILAGMVVNGRPVAEDGDKVVGCFLNTLPFREQFNAQGLGAYVQSVDNRLKQMKKYEGLSLLALSKRFSEEGNTENPFFDTLYNYVDFHVYQQAKGQDASQEEEGIPQLYFELTNTFLNVHVIPTSGGFHILWNRSRKLSCGMRNQDLCRMHLDFLRQLVASPEQSLKETNLLASEQARRITAVFNKTEVDYTSAETILDLWAEQWSTQAEKTAIVFEDRTVTFQEMEVSSNQLAHFLQSRHGLQAGDLVGLKLERSEWLPLSILAILKIGAAYVPIDAGHPEERIAYIQKDSGFQHCIDQDELNAFQAEKDSFSTTFDGPRPTGTDAAYAIYTSGSTGRPKGVVNGHAGLYNRLLWMKDNLQIDQKDVLLQKTPYTFDVSVWELLMSLVAGNQLVIAKPEGHKDPAYLQDVIETHFVSILHFVPSMLGAFLGEIEEGRCSSLRQVVCSGEALPAAMVRNFQQKMPNSRIHNYYGPTEAGIDVTAIDLTAVDLRKDKVSIGSPVANTKIYILNDGLQMQSIGVPGELLIGGVQLAHGYLKREALNREKFIDNPFGSGRLYRTGDLASWRTDGQIDFIGRIDHQVKIRGNRVELGEIEAVLLQAEKVVQAVAVIREDASGNKRLLAYVQTKEGYDQAAVFQHLRSQLPEYMIPALLIALEAFPLTTNGKLNRKALPAPDVSTLLAKQYVAPETAAEQQLAEIWQDILGLEQVGTKDNFFQIGGDSIISIRLISRINKLLDTSLKVTHLYEYNNIQSLAAFLDDRKEEDAQAKQTKEDILKSFGDLREEVLGK
ncbi:MAG: amino acid adenylation domain-containing protein [Bacteroidota bacterium]